MTAPIHLERHQAKPKQEAHPEETILPSDLPPMDRAALRRAGKILIVLFIGLFLLGTVPAWIQSRRITADAKRLAEAEPIVEVTKPHRAPSESSLTLPADARPYEVTALYPRSSGYLKTLNADIGDHVAAGQLLAEIDSPEVDAQLNQAKATLGRAVSDEKLARTTLERYEGFAKGGGVTQQQLDEKKSAANQASAALEAARSEVDRLSHLQSFEKVLAPFDGTVTTRNYDLGALLSPSISTGGKEIFRVENSKTLRIFANVPQTYATQVKEGEPAAFVVTNYPDREFKGTVARTSKSLDPASRTLDTEVDIPNPDGLLVPGMYGQVKFELVKQKPLLIPTSGVIFDAEGTRVAVVVDGKIHFKNVTLGRDFGTEVEAAHGIDESDLVVTNPGQKMREGGVVQVQEKDAEKKAS